MSEHSFNLLPLLLLLLWLAGCASAPPSRPGDICDIFDEKGGWYEDAKASYERWGTPIQVQMSIIFQESGYRDNVRPPRRRILWIIPWRRPSSAYGYTQALDSTWDWYKKETSNGWADRDDFDDATDFVGWYVNKSHQVIGISKWDAYSNYLAYHEGQTGYKRGSYKRKPWLMKVAGRVNARSQRYAQQLHGCRERLERGFSMWPF